MSVRQLALTTAVLLLALWLRWPASDWPHIDEHIFIERTLGFWSGDLNPHFFNYPTLQLYIASALQYLYYLVASPVPREAFVAWNYFVDGADVLAVARAATILMAVGTVAAVFRIGVRLYGFWGGLSASFLLAVFPLHVRFAHLAATDVPATFWLSLALLGAVRIAQEGHRRDYLLAGVCIGLAAATKYPAALGATAVVAAAWSHPKRDLWLAAAAALGAFALATPYVLLDFAAFWRDFAAMGQEHLLGGVGDKVEGPGVYLLQHSLRYGLGLVGVAGVLGAILYRPRAWRRAELPILVAFAAFTVLALAAESVFMRYAVPLAPPAALLCARLLTAQQPRVWAFGLLLLAIEPLYASHQLRTLRSHADTRSQAAAYLAAQAPAERRVFSDPPGLAPLLHRNAVMTREKAYLKSFSETDLIRAYALLARRDDLPPVHGFWSAEQLAAQLAPPGTAAADSTWILRYTHPLLAPAADPSHAAFARTHWHAEFAPGATDETVFDRVDRYFAPIGGFAHAARPGPTIAIGKVPLSQAPPPMPPTRDFFAILHQLHQSNLAAEQQDWRRIVEINTQLMRQFTFLRQLVDPSYLYKLCLDLGTAWDKLGDPQRSRHYRDQARLLLERG